LNRAVPELLIVLQREVQLTKEEWRSAGAQRRLAAYDVEARLLAVWSRFRTFGDGVVRVPLGADGADEPGSHEALKPKHLIPGFSIRREGDVFEIELDAERCRTYFGSPARASRRVAVLRAWQPVQIEINGRRSTYSGQTYLLSDFVLAWCVGDAPPTMRAIKQVDLNADVA
jgi:hypothetical protein